MTQDRLHIGNLGPGDIALLKDVAEAAAESAVKKWFTAMGLSPDDPISAQQGFVTLREVTAKVQDPEFRADLDWTRRTRKRHESIIGKAVLTMVAISIATAAHSMWTGVRSLLNVH